jgi:hypothetical protein
MPYLIRFTAAVALVAGLLGVHRLRETAGYL